MADRWETITNTSNCLDPRVSTLGNRHLSYQPVPNKEFEPNKSSGSKACDPITILDEDEQDAAEIKYIDLEKGNEAPTKRNYTAPTNQAVAGTQLSEFQSMAENPSPYDNIQGLNTARHTTMVTHPLFRALTKDDFPAQIPQSVPRNRSIGFKAWYGTHDSHRTENRLPEIQEKAINSSPSITLYNEKRTKKTRKDCDAPQFEMSVLNSKRKRTMGELGYNELIAPAQIESPSEKLARMAKKRRKRQERCDILSQDTNAGDTQSASCFDYSYGHEDDTMAKENTGLAVSPIVYEPVDSQETVAGVDDECNWSLFVREPSTEGHRGCLATQCRENPRDGYTGAYGIRSTQATVQDHGAQEHGDNINAACSSNSASRRHNGRRICGPTSACGVFSPEKKPPVKRSNRGAFHCPRCDTQFTTSKGVNYHFGQCVAMYGNPKSLKWNDHPSLERVGKRAAAATNVPHTMSTGPSTAAVSERSTQSYIHIGKQTASGTVRAEGQATPLHVPKDTQVGISAPIATMRATQLDSDTQAPTLSNLPDIRHTIKDNASSSSCAESKFDHPKSPVEHRATAGKGLSHETLKNFRETGNWNCGMEMDQDVDEASDEETEIPDIAYHYIVQKREWLETEEDAIESSMGPFHTMSEANAVATKLVQTPRTDGLERIESTGWSYYYEQDEIGMQKHMATVLEIHIETAVQRVLVPANDRVSLPKSAFIVAPRVYIVHELQWVPTCADAAITGSRHCQSLTHGVFTLLNKANERASAEYLETLTGNWGNSEYDLLQKAEAKSDLEKKVRDLKRENDCFQEEIKLDNDGFAKVWVESALVEGPRN